MLALTQNVANSYIRFPNQTNPELWNPIASFFLAQFNR